MPSKRTHHHAKHEGQRHAGAPPANDARKLADEAALAVRAKRIIDVAIAQRAYYTRLSLRLIPPFLLLLSVLISHCFPHSSVGHYIHTFAESYTPSVLKLTSLKHWSSVAPWAPSNMMHAWALGFAEAELKSLQAAGATTLEPTRAIAIHSLLGGNFFSTNETPINYYDIQTLLTELHTASLATIAADTLTLTGRQSLFARFFSLVNALWFIGIGGVLATIGTVAQQFLGRLYVFIRDTIMFLWKNIVQHIWRIVVYILTASILICLDNDTVSIDVRIYSSLFAVLAATIAVGTEVFESGRFIDTHLSLLWDPCLQSTLNVVFVFAALLFAIAAIITNSSLLGFFSVTFLYSLIGFGHGTFPGGYVIGFENKISATRCAFASLVLVVIVLSARFAGISAISPFEAGVQSYGVVGGYVALLVLDNVFIYLAITVGAIVGELAPLHGLSNTSYVFLYLKLLNDISRILSHFGFAFSVLVMSTILIATATLSHKHAKELGEFFSRI